VLISETQPSLLYHRVRENRDSFKVIPKKELMSVYSIFKNDMVDDLLYESGLNVDRCEKCFVVTIDTEIYNVKCEVIIDTGSEISIVEEEFLSGLEDKAKCKARDLPVTNISMIGATGKINRTIHRQVMLELVDKCGLEIPMVFLVARRIQVPILVGCDQLRKVKAVINLEKLTVTMFDEGKNFKFDILNNQVSLVGSVQNCNTIVKSNQSVACSGVNEMCEFEDEWGVRMSEIMNFKSKTESLNIDQNCKLVDLFCKYKDVFSNKPGKAKDFVCHLNIKPEAKIFRKSYPVPIAKRKQVQDKINDMLADGIIEYGESQYTSPIVAVTKKDGSIRLCLDARQINQVIVPDCNAPEDMEEILKRFHGKQYFTSLDATSGYWNVELDKESRKYVSFIFEGRNYSFTRLPFGLLNSVSVFTRCMDQVLGAQVRELVSVYVDDILIASETWEEHLYKVELVLKRFRDNNVTLKLDKANFITQEIKFLGHILSPQGIEVDKSKTKAIMDFPRPKNKKQLQSFLGLCNYYRKFQHHYSELTAKFKDQLSGNQHWKWDDADDQNFLEIKKAFLNSVMLKHPDFSRTLFLNCDASDLSLGSELYQLSKENEHNVVAFASRKLLDAERRYTTTEKELLSVVFAVTKFRTYLLGNKVVVRSDHKAISFFKRYKLSHGRLTRWCLVLQEYNIEWEFIPGKCNIVADTLSRVSPEGYDDDCKRDQVYKVLVNLKEGDELKEIVEEIRQQQLIDEKLIIIKDKLAIEDECVSEWYSMSEGLLFRRLEGLGRKWKLIVPDSVSTKIILDYHERYGHMGRNKVTKALLEHLYIKGINKKVAKAIENCDICQKVKINNIKRDGEIQSILAKKPLERVFVDICGPFPSTDGRMRHKFIFILVDCFSKYVRLFKVAKANTKSLLKIIIEKYVPEVGKPERIVSDQGTQFKGAGWRNTLAEIGIRTGKTSIYHPQSNISERVLRETGRLLRTYCHDRHKEWGKFVDKIENFLNLAYHESLGCSPYEVMWRRKPTREIEEICSFPNEEPEIDYEENLMNRVEKHLLLKARERREWQRRKKSFKCITFSVGDLVLVRNHQLPSSEKGLMKKLFLLYEGPYKIVQNNSPNVYVVGNIISNKVKGVYNTNQLKLYKSNRIADV
jgi:transposase InsO family protein